MGNKSRVDELWGDDGPYSQAQLITEVRILDDEISRTFLIVSVNINPFTIKLIKKNLNAFKNDGFVIGIVSSAVYKGPGDGYSIYTFQEEYVDETVMERAKLVLNETKNAIIRMHQFIMESLKDGTKGKHRKTMKKDKTDRKRMIDTQQRMSRIFIKRYLTESCKNELSDLKEANMVMKCVMEWWNNKLTIDDRLRIETLPPNEQEKIFMEAEVDFSASTIKPTTGDPKIDCNDLCPCGSGIKYKKCCFLKMH